MKIDSTLTDEAVLQALGERLEAARLDQNLTQAQLADKAGIAKRTVERLEAGDSATRLPGFLRVCRALGLLERLDALYPEPGVSPMAQLKLRRQRRQRATGARAKRRAPAQWTWGAE